ncbi:MAG: hypothetical protein JXQ73_19410 [Phycisphaerae bacterium]|nr:hypothetical protein [Phycisphaerae bacterium]
MDVQFAIELEPGPLYALGGLAVLELPCSVVDEWRYERLSRRVGLNMDIAH